MRQDERKICSMAIETFGVEAQRLMVMEEMSELQKELCKSARGRDNVDAIAEEIADVEIMLRQMKLLYGCERAVEEWKQKKIERLYERVMAVRDEED